MLSSHTAMVTDSVIFVDLGVKVDGTYYCDLLLSQQFTLHVSSELIFHKTVSHHMRHAM